jgi:hypothetical protein
MGLSEKLSTKEVLSNEEFQRLSIIEKMKCPIVRRQYILLKVGAQSQQDRNVQPETLGRKNLREEKVRWKASG